ncbi:MAG: symmetrical bis(5'-nucleosyl)-tetraphosphatase [Mariprofundaceae bacterium]
MAVYAVGDIQGCYNPLRRLLDKIHFNPASDQLWCVGDLVNRGPDSLATLRFLKSLGKSCLCVLGNHDLHLLERACGGRGYKRDTFNDVLKAPDRDEMIDWLRYRPLFHHDTALGWCMVHAGLHPDWTLKKTAKRARKIEETLQSNEWQVFCNHLHHAEFPSCEPADKLQRRLFWTAVLTRTRYCTQDGYFDWGNRAGEASTTKDKPWYAHDKLTWLGEAKIVFGHWAARGLVADQSHVLGLDSGCVWGGRLSAARLDGKKLKVTQVRCEACQRHES